MQELQSANLSCLPSFLQPTQCSFELCEARHAPEDAGAQAKNCGDVLVVGLIPDSEILRCKGPPVCNEEERKLQVETVKWVDEVITGGSL